MQQHGKRDRVVLGAGDQPHLILILVIVAVKERELLLAVSRIIEQIDVERQCVQMPGKAAIRSFRLLLYFIVQLPSG